MSFKTSTTRSCRWRGVVAALLGVLLVSCGGGQQVDKFVPARVLVFGDETSRIEDRIDATGVHNGDKYTINFKADANTERDCTLNPIWVQVLATAYSLVFPECNKAAVATTSRILATVGAKVADVNTQVQAFVAADKFAGNDLVTVMAGANDILEQYNAIRAGTSTEEQASAVLDQRGADLAGIVNFIGTSGGKVLIATAQDMGLTPFAVKENVARPDLAPPALLTRLTSRFNTKLRIGLINDGHMIGLLLFDEQIQSIAKTTGWVVDQKACLDTAVNPLTLCDTTTTVDDTRVTPPVKATGSSWLWADDTHISSGGHSALGSLAYNRASNNPF
jgi:hypothetical protein